MKWFFLISSLIMGSNHVFAKPVQAVEHVDIQKFMGRWYEIAVIPYFFEKNCVGTNANYSLRKDGAVDVRNICFDRTLDGEEKWAEGIAKVDDRKTNAKLRVSFFRPFSAKYWIIDLDENYTYAVTANPNRKYLWILSRTPQMEESVYQRLVKRAKEQGFNTRKLVKTLQPSYK